MIIFIDASNIGEGGGLTHLKEILSCYKNDFKIILLAQKKILNQIPSYNFLTKKNHILLEKNLLFRIIFQIFFIDNIIPKNSIVYSVTGDFLGKHKPLVSMSTNMLLYERDIWKDIKSLKEILRFWINFHKQKISFNNSTGIIFISEYAKNYISNQLNLKNKIISVINHGVSDRFQKNVKIQKSISEYDFNNPFKFTYVSTIHVYKNQWNVVDAIAVLREKGYPVELNLIGSVIYKPAGNLLNDKINKVDPLRSFIHEYGHIPYDKIDEIYNFTDGIIFASSCENMPNILIESMLTGIPIACSDKQPMPEFLKDCGFYFDAKNIHSIVFELEEFLNSPKERELNAKKSIIEASKYSWQSTINKISEFLIINYNHAKK